MNEEREKLFKEQLITYLRKHFPFKENNEGLFEYEIYPHYDDKIPESIVAEILMSNDPRETFYMKTEETYYDYIDEERNAVVDDLLMDFYPADAMERMDMEWYLRDLINELVVFKIPFEHYEKQLFDVDLMIDTGDGDYDFTCNSEYPYSIPDEASLVWLAKTQGYDKCILEDGLAKGNVGEPNGFLDSVRQEYINEASRINCLTFLVKMSLDDLITLHELIHLSQPNGAIIYDAQKRPDCGTVKISKNATAGLFDPWSGGGSLFEIKLEKDLILPIKYISSALPDETGHEWSVQSVYGMMNSAWKEDVVTEISR